MLGQVKWACVQRHSKRRTNQKHQNSSSISEKIPFPDNLKVSSLYRRFCLSKKRASDSFIFLSTGENDKKVGSIAEEERALCGNWKQGSISLWELGFKYSSIIAEDEVCADRGELMSAQTDICRFFSGDGVLLNKCTFEHSLSLQSISQKPTGQINFSSAFLFEIELLIFVDFGVDSLGLFKFRFGLKSFFMYWNSHLFELIKESRSCLEAMSSSCWIFCEIVGKDGQIGPSEGKLSVQPSSSFSNSGKLVTFMIIFVAVVTRKTLEVPSGSFFFSFPDVRCCRVLCGHWYNVDRSTLTPPPCACVNTRTITSASISTK